MKIIKEKKIRAEYISNQFEKVVGRMMKTVTGKGTPGIQKSYRNVCKVTGRSRGVISGKNRQVWRALADRGELEGYRRASW